MYSDKNLKERFKRDFYLFLFVLVVIAIAWIIDLLLGLNWF